MTGYIELGKATELLKWHLDLKNRNQKQPKFSVYLIAISAMF
jgi:hypothetical protein